MSSVLRIVTAVVATLCLLANAQDSVPISSLLPDPSACAGQISDNFEFCKDIPSDLSPCGSVDQNDKAALQKCICKKNTIQDMEGCYEELVQCYQDNNPDNQIMSYISEFVSTCSDQITATSAVGQDSISTTPSDSMTTSDSAPTSTEETTSKTRTTSPTTTPQTHKTPTTSATAATTTSKESSAGKVPDNHEAKAVACSLFFISLAFRLVFQ